LIQQEKGRIKVTFSAGHVKNTVASPYKKKNAEVGKELRGVEVRARHRDN